MKTRLILTVAASALLMVSCKTNEANYRAAYEVAKAKSERLDEDSTAVKTVFAMSEPRPVTTAGVTLPMVTEPVAFTPDGGATRATVKRYCVIVGRFRQVFNARQMRKRLIAGGYEGAMIVNNRDGVYYVIAKSADTPAEASAALAEVKNDSALKLRGPLPLVLQPRHLAK